MSATSRSLRFLRSTALRPPSTCEVPIRVDAKEGDGRCVPSVYPKDGWWHAEVTFEGQRRYIGRFGSETQAGRVADRWRAALLGDSEEARRLKKDWRSERGG